MMKKAVLMILAVVLFVLTIYLSGCGWSQPGETVAEGHRRHIRNLKVNQQSLSKDVDSLMLFKEPSKLSDMKIE